MGGPVLSANSGQSSSYCNSLTAPSSRRCSLLHRFSTCPLHMILPVVRCLSHSLITVTPDHPSNALTLAQVRLRKVIHVHPHLNMSISHGRGARSSARIRAFGSEFLRGSVNRSWTSTCRRLSSRLPKWPRLEAETEPNSVQWNRLSTFPCRKW